MEYEVNQDGQSFRPLTEAETEWGRNLMKSHRLDHGTESGVMSYGRSVADNDALWVVVGRNTDLDDKEAYPDEFDGNRVVYERLPLAEEE